MRFSDRYHTTMRIKRLLPNANKVVSKNMKKQWKPIWRASNCKQSLKAPSSFILLPVLIYNPTILIPCTYKKKKNKNGHSYLACYFVFFNICKNGISSVVQKRRLVFAQQSNISTFPVTAPRIRRSAENARLYYGKLCREIDRLQLGYIYEIKDGEIWWLRWRAWHRSVLFHIYCD